MTARLLTAAGVFTFLSGVLAGQAAAVVKGFPAVVEKVRAGTVMVEARKRSETRFGSGFLLEPEGVVVTALHVVEGAHRIRVVIPNTYLTSDALLAVSSPKWDVAVLRVTWPEELAFPGLTLSEGKGLLPVGTEVAYTGYGFGTDEAFINVLSTYRGIISSHVPNGKKTLYHLSGLVNAGLSGSALYLPETGAVAGVVTRHFGSPGSTMGFGGAVPGPALKSILKKVGRLP